LQRWWTRSSNSGASDGGASVEFPIHYYSAKRWTPWNFQGHRDARRLGNGGGYSSLEERRRWSERI